MKKRVLSCVLCAALAFSMVSVPVSARENRVKPGAAVAEVDENAKTQIQQFAEKIDGLEAFEENTLPEKKSEDVVSAQDITTEAYENEGAVTDPCGGRVNYNGYALKQFIETYGGKVSSGNKGIRVENNVEGMYVASVIEVYSNDQLKFSTQLREDSAWYPMATIEFYYHLADNQCTDINAVFFLTASDYLQSDGVFDGASYYYGKALEYWFDSYLEDELCQELAAIYDAALAVGMVQMQAIVNSMGCNMADLGFYAYDTPLSSNHLLANGNNTQCALCGASVLPFMDVYSDGWYFNYVKNVYHGGYMTGLNETAFGPSDTLVRAQFAVILHRMAGGAAAGYSGKFSDVPDGQWYTTAIMWASNQKVVTGYANGKFGVADNINREQMAVMMYRYADTVGLDVSEKADFKNYGDASSVSEYAKEAMRWAVGTGIITGKDNGTKLDPLGNANRAECATIITRFLAYYGI